MPAARTAEDHRAPVATHPDRALPRTQPRRRTRLVRQHRPSRPAATTRLSHLPRFFPLSRESRVTNNWGPAYAGPQLFKGLYTEFGFGPFLKRGIRLKGECLNNGVDSQNGVQIGTSVGAGVRAEAAIGFGGGFGNIGGRSTAIECANVSGTGATVGIAWPAYVYGSGGFGFGIGCSMMWTTYRGL